MAVKYLKVCSKPVKTVDGKVFDAFFAYRQEKNTEGVLVDVLSPTTDKEGKPAMIAKSIRVALTGKAEKKLKAEDNFPYLLTLEDGKEPLDFTELEQPDFYVTIDKDKDGIKRLDKNGNQHLIAIISDYRASSHVEPLSSFSLDDIDNF